MLLTSLVVETAAHLADSGLAHAVLGAVQAQDGETPKPEDVKAGWVGFAVFIGLIVAVALLMFSMARHLRGVRREREAEEDSRIAEDQLLDARDAADAGDRRREGDQPS